MNASPGVALADLAIAGYQRYLSPYKGFRCAHCVLHGGLSCSEAVKRLIRLHGVFSAWPHVRERFAQCRAAAQTLRAQPMVAPFTAQAEGDGKDKKKGSAWDLADCIPNPGCDLPCDLPCDCGF
jgi:putative component of membrane protein insertase Oxa1/YidC/SpoIIIJ protein YidD